MTDTLSLDAQTSCLNDGVTLLRDLAKTVQGKTPDEQLLLVREKVGEALRNPEFNRDGWNNFMSGETHFEIENDGKRALHTTQTFPYITVGLESTQEATSRNISKLTALIGASCAKR